MVEDVKMFSPLIPHQLQEAEPLLAPVPKPPKAQASQNTPVLPVSAKTEASERTVPAATFPTKVDSPVTAQQVSTSNLKPYTIQILALKRRQQANEDYLTGLDTTQIKTYKGKDGYLRYVIGCYDDQSAAESYLKSLKSNDRFKDAWIRELSLLKKISY